TLGWSVHRPGEVSGLQPSAPVLRGGSRIAAVSSPRRAQKSTSRRPRHAPCAYIMNPQNLPPPPAPIGGELSPPAGVRGTGGSAQCAPLIASYGKRQGLALTVQCLAEAPPPQLTCCSSARRQKL